MNARTAFALALLTAGGLALSSCKPPKYVPYTSIHGDFRCSVPWGWDVLTDEEGTHYANTAFIGPFDPDFLLGAPSLSVRWHAYAVPHRLPDGLFESYASVDDYIGQTLAAVYGSQRIMRQEPRDIELTGGRKARNFVVLSPAAVSKDARWGTALDVATKQPVNLRQHAYVIVPLKTGFYAIVYPATRDGYASYESHFNELVNTFVPLTEGPGGPDVAPAQASAKPASANPFR